MATSKINLENLYRIGDSITTGAPLNGLITSSTKSCIFTLFLDKPLDPSVSTFTITNLKGALRGVSGYVDGTSNSTDLLSTYSCYISKSTPSQLKIYVDSDTTMTNVTNNTPVCLYGGTLTVTFS